MNATSLTVQDPMARIHHQQWIKAIVLSLLAMGLVALLIDPAWAQPTGGATGTAAASSPPSRRSICAGSRRRAAAGFLLPSSRR